MDAGKTREFVQKMWDTEITPSLCEYISIPNQSPAYDPEWATNGFMDKAIELMVNWVKSKNCPGLELEIIRDTLENGKPRTPIIFITIDATLPADKAKTVLLYGHMDKQPPMTETWYDGMHPYTPIIRDGKLYGRGGADDGYAIFASLTAILALKDQSIAHDRYVIIIEACEESGSDDLPHYVEKLKSRIGTPNMIVCLDSGCSNYEQFFITTSLRGLVALTVKVSVLKDGVHSGHASGIVGSSFRVMHAILNRFQDAETGKILISELYTEIPQERIDQANGLASVIGDTVWEEFPYVEGAGPLSHDNVELILNRTWKPSLSVVGVDGMPPASRAGNVLRPYTTFVFSFRLPPSVDASVAKAAVQAAIDSVKVDYAKVEILENVAMAGWNAPPTAAWLQTSLDKASQTFYNKPAIGLGEGGSIPFMGMLGKMFPEAQFVITGVLGPQSNAHGPNEFIHLPYAAKLNCCISSILADHANL
eukprot:TRINITY_DN6069_c0_g1_i1.p1 TRINITY_DN6069_c0_g1~~TRINITY_DN6069_c0_g1_i1.p1  ORF type:complete len:479 (-),score=115.46 TRINITY_DN6069_c0_g1_i1:87-1523(-)